MICHVFFFQVQVSEMFQLWHVSAVFLHWTGKQETQAETPNSGVLRRGKFKQNITDLDT